MNEALIFPVVALTVGGGLVTGMFIGGLIPATFPYLNKQIRSLNKSERLSAVYGLGRLGGHRATSLLYTLLNHHELDMRRASIESLAATKDPSVIEPIGSALTDTVPLIRRAAAIGLSGFEDLRATELLCVALRDTDEQVVSAAAVALAHRKDPTSIEPLCRALASSTEIAHAVGRALVDFGMEAFDTLVRLLPEAGAISGERMISVMMEINPEASIEPLKQVLASAKVQVTVKAAIRALTSLKAPGLVSQLCNLLLDHEALGRADAIEALQELGDPEGITAIIQILRDADPHLRRSAVQALTDRTEPEVIGALCSVLADEDPAVARDSALALGTKRDRRILKSMLLALYPLDGESVVRVIGEAIKRPVDELDSAGDFLQVLERWAGPNSRQDDQTARFYMQSALILLLGPDVRGFRDLTSTVLVFKGHEWTSITREERLHPLAAESLKFLRGQRDVRTFQSGKAYQHH